MVRDWGRYRQRTPALLGRFEEEFEGGTRRDHTGAPHRGVEAAVGPERGRGIALLPGRIVDFVLNGTAVGTAVDVQGSAGFAYSGEVEKGVAGAPRLPGA